MLQLTYSDFLVDILLLLVSLFYYKSARQPAYQNKGSYIFIFITFVLYSTFGFNSGDFLHYHDLFREISVTKLNLHLEDFYYSLLLLSPNYFIWRFMVWGLATFILIMTFKRLNYPPQLTCLIAVLILMYTFSNLRNSLGYVALFYSITFITKPLKIKPVSYCLAFLGIWCTIFLHKSMPFYIFVMFISFIPIKKWIIVVSLALFPILYETFNILAYYFLNTGIGGEDFNVTGMSHLEREQFSVVNINGLLQQFINKLPILILLFYSLRRILSFEIQNRTTKLFVTYSYWLIYISFLFYNQPTSSFLSPRFWDASLFSLTIALPLLILKQKDKLLSVSYYLLILSNIYNMSYALYKL